MNCSQTHSISATSPASHWVAGTPIWPIACWSASPKSAPAKKSTPWPQPSPTNAHPRLPPVRNTRATQLLFELSDPGRRSTIVPCADVAATPVEQLLPKSALASEPPPLPELAEPDIVRHYANLSTLNMSIDTHFYPLGSCTMKYNPKRNERLAALPGLADLHPYQPEETLARPVAIAVRTARDPKRNLRPRCRLAAARRRSARRAHRAHGRRRLLPRFAANSAPKCSPRIAPTAPIPPVRPWPAFKPSQFAARRKALSIWRI